MLYSSFLSVLSKSSLGSVVLLPRQQLARTLTTQQRRLGVTAHRQRQRCCIIRTSSAACCSSYSAFFSTAAAPTTIAATEMLACHAPPQSPPSLEMQLEQEGIRLLLKRECQHQMQRQTLFSTLRLTTPTSVRYSSSMFQPFISELLSSSPPSPSSVPSAILTTKTTTTTAARMLKSSLCSNGNSILLTRNFSSSSTTTRNVRKSRSDRHFSRVRSNSRIDPVSSIISSSSKNLKLRRGKNVRLSELITDDKEFSADRTDGSNKKSVSTGSNKKSLSGVLSASFNEEDSHGDAADDDVTVSKPFVSSSYPSPSSSFDHIPVKRASQLIQDLSRQSKVIQEAKQATENKKKTMNTDYLSNLASTWTKPCMPPSRHPAVQEVLKRLANPAAAIAATSAAAVVEDYLIHQEEVEERHGWNPILVFDDKEDEDLKNVAGGTTTASAESQVGDYKTNYEEEEVQEVKSSSSGPTLFYDEDDDKKSQSKAPLSSSYIAIDRTESSWVDPGLSGAMRVSWDANVDAQDVPRLQTKIEDGVVNLLDDFSTSRGKVSWDQLGKGKEVRNNSNSFIKVDKVDDKDRMPSLTTFFTRDKADNDDDGDDWNLDDDDDKEKGKEGNAKENSNDEKEGIKDNVVEKEVKEEKGQEAVPWFFS